MVCASWAVAPPNSLRYHNTKQLALSHPLHPAVHSHREGAGHWEESISLCELVHQGEVDGLHTVLEIPVCCDGKPGELLGGVLMSSEFCFPLTTVDGRRPDDISVGVIKRQHSCFRSLFEGESCPAPFTSGSQFYCFHCLGREPAMRTRMQSGGQIKHFAVPQQCSASLCSHMETVNESDIEEDGKQEEKLALMYERLRTEVRITIRILCLCFYRDFYSGVTGFEYLSRPNPDPIL